MAGPGRKGTFARKVNQGGMMVETNKGNSSKNAVGRMTTSSDALVTRVGSSLTPNRGEGDARIMRTMPECLTPQANTSSPTPNATNVVNGENLPTSESRASFRSVDTTLTPESHENTAG